jgi:hypothetical protein
LTFIRRAKRQRDRPLGRDSFPGKRSPEAARRCRLWREAYD